MPYEVKPHSGKHCIFKRGAEKPIYCHDNARQAYAQMAAIMASEARKRNKDWSDDAVGAAVEKALTALPSAGDERYMLLMTSNAYRDREQEIITEKALRAYTDSAWDGAKFVAHQPLLYWHGGDALGDIMYADMEAAFLIEIARERADAIVDLARPDQRPARVSIAKMWDTMQIVPEMADGASHKFIYVAGDQKDGVYEQILKVETTVLPLYYAANEWSSAWIIEE